MSNFDTPYVGMPPAQRRKRWMLWTAIGAGSIVILLVAWLVLRPGNNHPSTQQPKKEPISVRVEGITANQTISETVLLKLVLSDPSRVKKVAFYVDTKFAGVTYAAPFTFSLDTAKLANGKHTLVAKAYDQDNDAYSSARITFTVLQPVADEPASEPEPAALAPSTSTKKQPSAGSSSTSDSGGNSSPPPTPDTASPTVPGSVLLAATDGYTTNVSWAASTDNVGVTSYQVYRDGAVLGASTTTAYKDQTVVPGNTYEYAVVAVDAASNTSAMSTEPSITLVPTSVWIDGDTPQNTVDDTGSYELGVKFKPLVNGKISGIRFYKRSGDVATHTGNLWTSGGANLGSFTFSGESASGWQTGTFATPINVTAGTTYVASYFTPDAFYAYTGNYFSPANGGITSEYLSAPGSDGADGSNGVFRASAGFPSSSGSDTNYWVDVTFVPNLSAGGPTAQATDTTKTYANFPGTDNTGVQVGKRLPRRDRSVDAYQPNSVIENIELTKSNAVNLFANNTTVRNVRVAPTDGNPNTWGIRQNAGVSGATVQDTTIAGNGTTQMQYGIVDVGDNLTVRRVNISCYTNGIQANVDVTVEDSIVYSPCFYAGDHTDAFIATGGDNINLTHNTFHNNLAQTAAIGLFCDFGPITNATVTNNLLIGGGYALYAGSSGIGNCTNSQNNKFTNNKFSREVWPNGGNFGPVNIYTALPGNAFTGNTWLDDGTPVTP